jgi:Tfp pilus assembly protein PilO
MLSRFTKNIKAPELLRAGNRKLRIAAMCFGGLVLANLLVYFLLVSPSSAWLAAGESKYAGLRKRHAEAVLFTKQRRLFAGVMAGVPSQKDMPLLVKEFVQTARGLNLRVSSVKYDMPKRGGGELAMLAFAFPAEGRYPDIKRFIYSIETMDRLIGIQDVKLDAGQSGVKLEMRLMTYVKGQ